MRAHPVLRHTLIALALTFAPGLSLAQHEAHHPKGGAPLASPAGMTGMAPSPAAGTGDDKMVADGGMGGTSAANTAPAGGMAGMGGPSPQPGAAGPAPGGGMAEMMGAMMTPKPAVGGCMGAGCGSAASATPMYPSLMTLPVLTPEKRAEIEALASQQMNEGMAQLAKGSDALNRATQASDSPSMQQSIVMMRDALNELEAGIAAKRVLTEGKAPRNLALDWFKREMNLASPAVRDDKHGLSAFHLFTMGLLIVFAFAMLALYIAKMRRAAALFGRLEPDPTSPPPGSSPPLVGSSGPATPPTSKPPASEAKPPEAKPPEAKAPEAKPPEAKPPEAEPSEAKPPEAKPPEAKPPEAEPPEAEPPKAKSLHPRVKAHPHSAPSRKKPS